MVDIERYLIVDSNEVVDYDGLMQYFSDEHFIDWVAIQYPESRRHGFDDYSVSSEFVDWLQVILDEKYPVTDCVIRLTIELDDDEIRRIRGSA